MLLAPSYNNISFLLTGNTCREFSSKSAVPLRHRVLSFVCFENINSGEEDIEIIA